MYILYYTNITNTNIVNTITEYNDAIEKKNSINNLRFIIIIIVIVIYNNIIALVNEKPIKSNFHQTPPFRLFT